MSEDLDKMMEKLKKTKKKKVEEEKDPEEVKKKEEDLDLDVDNDPDEDIKDDDPKEPIVGEQKVIDSVESEVALLQNDGIFRREMLVALRELSNIQKVNAQALINLNELIGDILNAKKQ